VNITTATPVEIDTHIVKIKMAVNGLMNQFKHQERILQSEYSTEQDRVNAQVAVKELAEQHYKLDAELLTLSVEFGRRGGWERYYLVQNTGGHVHTSMGCDTCFDDTDFGWLTQFSGTSHEAMGRLSGMGACARCFPGLPAEIMTAKRDLRIDTPERIAARNKREEEKAAKAAKAAAKAITNPDGTPLEMPDIFGRFDVVKTEIAASRRVMEAAYDLKIYPGNADAPVLNQAIDLGLAALAHKRGTTIAIERDALTKKIEAKYRRESK
jgi:hypothetical protein